MQVTTSPPVPQLLVTNTTATGDKTLMLNPGQILNASVITVANGQVTLQIDQALLQARTALTLLAGQKLELQVQKSDRQVVLQLTQKSIDQAVLTQALRQHLPRQVALDQALNPILRLLRPAAQTPASSLPAVLQNITRQLFERLPERQQLQTPQGLKQALENSGLSLESRLRQGLQGSPASSPREDLKAGLLQLQHALRLQIIRLEQQRELPHPETRQIQNRLPEIRQQLQNLLQSDALPRLLERTAIQPKLNSQLTQFRQLAMLVMESPGITAAGSGPERDRMLTLLHSLFNLANTLLNQPPLAQPTSASLGLVSHLLALRSELEKLLLSPPASQPARTVETTRGDTGLKNPSPLQQLGELLRHAEAATSRIQTQQLNALVEQESGRLLWSLELPLRQGDKIELLRLRIERDDTGNSGGEQQAPLVVTLRLELEHAGPVSARLTLLGEQVSVVIWAEHEATLAAAREHLPELEQGLARTGLKAERVSLLQGQAPADTPRPGDADKPPLLDLEA